MFHVLIVEDDKKLRKLFSVVLSRNGYSTIEAEDGEKALEILDKEYVDIIITDLMMPRMDGFSLIKALRDSNYSLPILVITVKEQFQDKQKGFMSGADDYMVKPVDVNEMVLRVGALLRRAKIVSERKIIIGDTELIYDSLTVCKGGETFSLPQKEFYLLFKLASYPNRTFTRQQLMDEIWGLDTESDAKTVDVHINRLRKRFKGNKDFMVITIRGLGYKLVKNSE